MNHLLYQNTQLAQKKLEQDEAHFKAREQKKISPSVREHHLNLGSVDGINPAEELQQRDIDYMLAKSANETRDMMENDLRTKGCQVAVPIYTAKVALAGRWVSGRYQVTGLTLYGLPVSLSNTSLEGIDFEQLQHDYEANRDISSRDRKALNGSMIIVPKTIHFLLEQTRNTSCFFFITTGKNSILTKATIVWVTWIEDHRQQLIEVQQNGHRDLPAQISYQFFMVCNNYIIAAQTGVPDPSILDSSLIMQQILNGNHNIILPSVILDALHPRRNNNSNNQNRRPNNSINPRPNNNNNTNTNRASNSIRLARVNHANQP